MPAGICLHPWNGSERWKSCLRVVRTVIRLLSERRKIRTTVEIFLLRSDARTRQRYSVGVGRDGLFFLGTGLLCPLTETRSVSIQMRGSEGDQVTKARKKLYQICIFRSPFSFSSKLNDSLGSPRNNLISFVTFSPG